MTQNSCLAWVREAGKERPGQRGKEFDEERRGSFRAPAASEAG
jgi:hypothetical protein